MKKHYLLAFLILAFILIIGMNSYADEVGNISVDINDSYGNAYTLSLWFGDYTNGIPDGLMQPTEIVQNTCLMLETALGEDIQSVLTDPHTEIRLFSYSPSDGGKIVQPYAFCAIWFDYCMAELSYIVYFHTDTGSVFYETPYFDILCQKLREPSDTGVYTLQALELINHNAIDRVNLRSYSLKEKMAYSQEHFQVDVYCAVPIIDGKRSMPDEHDLPYEQAYAIAVEYLKSKNDRGFGIELIEGLDDEMLSGFFVDVSFYEDMVRQEMIWQGCDLQTRCWVFDFYEKEQDERRLISVYVVSTNGFCSF